MRLLTALLFVSISIGAIAQEKKVIDHTAYNDWKSLKGAQISNDGKFISYEIKPHRGDGVLCVYNVETGETDTIPRAYRAQFSGGSSYLAFKITPGFDTLRTCELKEIKRTKWPKDSLGIYYLGQDSLAKYPEVKSFTTSDVNDWMTVEFSHNNLTEVPGKKKKKKKRRKNKEPEYESKGKLLWVFHPEFSKEIENVTGYEMSYEGDHVAYKTHRSMDEIDSVKVNFFSFTDRAIWTWKDQYTAVDIQTFNSNENGIAFYATQDTSEVKLYDIHLLAVDGSSYMQLDSAKVGFDIDHSISRHYDLSFTMNDDILFFGIGDRELEEPEDTLTKKEKVHLDLWHYKDQRLQPQQLLEKDRDLEASWMHAYHIKSDKVVQLENDTLDVYSEYNMKGKYLMGMSEETYANTYNWVSPRPRDFYRVNVETGEAELVLTGQKFWPSMAPSGKYMEFYCDGEHHMLDLETGNEDCITCNTADVVWTEDMNGMPMEAYPKNAGNWTRDESKVLIQSEFDYWQYDRNDKTLASYTHDMGKLNNVELSLSIWERDSVYYEPFNVYFRGFDRNTKGSRFYELKEHDDHVDLVQTASFNANVMQLQRSKNNQRHIVRRMTFQDYPELYTFADDMAEMQKISETNPQQSEYNWGTVELTKWTSYDGFELEGLIYKPENFDSTKSYPLMVYFYELYADRLHSHYIPKPTASIIYATEYASAGYVVFMPDIRYKPGHPAKSAYDCIMSGTDHVLEQLPNVDSTRMALQGQSWGGYQTAQLVTMTNRYKAAMAGAPVANMFSAYGGIRWGSGYNRQFQYERTQSRIGYTIWERPELYVENSPLFHLPNVETPLMIMHNDADGAVPWYQGIELFTGLKRLGRPTWLLNYNDDNHNLMRNANRIDLSIRMRQFFDHYLLETPAPQWLTEGIPATVKGKEMRY
ncbi:prolyl oligopeptidase family serine peptidase [Crocinitomicaceae bacterium]|nr:prolyl oligopeptidase family serine peptidase [Crocinitomicaceae bacterium]